MFPCRHTYNIHVSIYFQLYLFNGFIKIIKKLIKTLDLNRSCTVEFPLLKPKLLLLGSLTICRRFHFHLYEFEHFNYKSTQVAII